MKKWLLGVLLCLALLSSMLVPGVASAHSGKAMHSAMPASSCYDWTCDGKYWDQQGCWNGGNDPNVHVIASTTFTASGLNKKIGVELLKSTSCGSVWTYSWVLDGSSVNQYDQIYFNIYGCSGNTDSYTNGPYTRSNMWSQMVGEVDANQYLRSGQGVWGSPSSHPYTVPANGYCITF